MRKSIFQIAQFKTFFGQELLQPWCPKLANGGVARKPERLNEHPKSPFGCSSTLAWLRADPYLVSCLLCFCNKTLSLTCCIRASLVLWIWVKWPHLQNLSVLQAEYFYHFQYFWIFHGYFQLFHGFRSNSPPLEPFGFVWTEYFSLEWIFFNCQQFVSQYLGDNGLQLPLRLRIRHQLTCSVCGKLCGTLFVLDEK